MYVTTISVKMPKKHRVLLVLIPKRNSSCRRFLLFSWETIFIPSGKRRLYVLRSYLYSPIRDLGGPDILSKSLAMKYFSDWKMANHDYFPAWVQQAKVFFFYNSSGTDSSSPLSLSLFSTGKTALWHCELPHVTEKCSVWIIQANWLNDRPLSLVAH